MEAAFISFLINKLGGIAVDQAQSRCCQPTPPLDQIHARIERITAEFKVMQAFLEDSNWSTDAAAEKAHEAWIGQRLQTLDLCDSNIVKLPHGVTQMKQLRHLFASYNKVECGGSTEVACFPTLEGAWQWKNLQTLHSVEANKKVLQQLGDMKELRSLYLVGVAQVHCPQLCTSLIKMSNLRQLNLFARSGEQLNFEMLNSPPPPLQKMYLSGRLFEGRMPKFSCFCAELTRVNLNLSQLIEDPLPSLGQLPKLVQLSLYPDAYVGQTLHFRRGWFLNLKILYLRGLKNLNDIVIEEGAMVSLCDLAMMELELKMVPHGIEFLPYLEWLVLRGMPEELREKLKKDNDNEDRRRVRHIPRLVWEDQLL